MRNGVALSLLETIISSFILMSAFLVMFLLLDSALRYISRSESQQVAASLAERYLEQMRVWSETPNGTVFNFQNPGLAAVYDNTVSVPADFPNFSITTKVSPVNLYSSCTSIEEPISTSPSYSPPLVAPRSIDGKSAQVQALVIWAGGQRSLTLVSLFAAPTLSPVSQLVISQSSQPALLGADQGINFFANATDCNNNPIQGLMFSWSVVPINGTATLTPARDGSVANLTNRVYDPPFAAPDYVGTPGYTGGQCFVQASATYHGQNITATSPVVSLYGP
jgi:hypothetical protein